MADMPETPGPMTAARRPRRPNGAPAARPLTVKVPPDLLATARAQAAERGETLSKVIVDHLETYVSKQET